jgi:hypothetical protein
VVHQLMAGPGSQGLYLLQRDGKVLDGNMPAVPARTGLSQITFTSNGQTREVLGVGALLAPGLFVFAGSDMAELRGVQSHLLKVMLFLLAVPCCWRLRAAPW